MKHSFEIRQIQPTHWIIVVQLLSNKQNITFIQHIFPVQHNFRTQIWIGFFVKNSSLTELTWQRKYWNVLQDKKNIQNCVENICRMGLSKLSTHYYYCCYYLLLSSCLWHELTHLFCVEKKMLEKNFGELFGYFPTNSFPVIIFWFTISGQNIQTTENRRQFRAFKCQYLSRSHIFESANVWFLVLFNDAINVPLKVIHPQW